MFSSLNARLWISYILLVVVVLCGATFGIFLALRQSPLLYRQTYFQLNLTAGLLSRRLQSVSASGDFNQIASVYLRETRDVVLRTAIINRSGKILLPEGNAETPHLPPINDPESLRIRSENEILSFRDDRGVEWFYIVTSINGELFLLTAIQRPLIPLRTILQDEFLGPIIRIGFLAIIFALFISWLIATWIAQPLERVSKSAKALAEGQYEEISINGPKEVKQLARTFNYMGDRVRTTLQSQRDFIANISHELKTPLTSIQGFAQAITDGTITSLSALKNAANVIQQETTRLNRLVNDLLTLAKLESGTMEMEMQKI